MKRTFIAELARNYEDVAERWSRMGTEGGVSPFQDTGWLASWYETLGREEDVEPLLVTIREGAQDVAGFPLILHRFSGLRIIEPADLCMTDYNAPVLSSAAPSRADDARRLVTCLRRALPPADLIAFTKMPAYVGRMANPVTLAGGVTPCRLSGWPLEIGDSLDAWSASFKSLSRRHLRQRMKAFRELPGARIVIAREGSEALSLYARFQKLSAQRLVDLGQKDMLSHPENRRFYDNLVQRTASSGSIVVAALEAEGRMLAGIMGILRGDHLIIPRFAMANAGREKLSPGILLLHSLIEQLHAEGVRCFDFTIGDYEYKRRIHATRMPLYDLHLALSPRGIPIAFSANLRGRVRQNPRLLAAARHLRGRVHSIFSFG